MQVPNFLQFIATALFFAATCRAQTGPGGVGTSSTNVLWLKADIGTSTTANNAPVVSWADQSGNGNSVTQTVTVQQPLFVPSLINGFAAVQFDNVSSPSGQNDKMLGPDSPVLDNTAGYTFFTVSRPQTVDGAARVLLSKRTTVSVDQSFMLFYYTGNTFQVDIETVNDRYATNTTFSGNNTYLIDMVYDGTLPTNSRSKTYLGETLDVTAKETSSFVPDNASPLIIGSTDATDPRPYGGYMSEIICYRVALGKAERIIVNNYLSAKYNIALSANDKYVGDNPANGNFDREAAGIGKDTIQPSGTISSNTTFSSTVAAGLGMSSVSGLDVGDYIIAGHASPSNFQIISDVAGISGVAPARWLRVWYVDVTNTGTANTVDIEFDMSDGGVTPNPLGSAANYVLLYRAGQSGTWTELATANAVSGDKVLFNSYTITLDGYYTIGTRNWPISPLPIALLSFTGEKQGTGVQLNWETASEQSNDYFTVQRSADAVGFTDLVKVPSKAPNGSSSQPLSYELLDSQPLKGTSYYRLLQTGLNGQQKTFNTISVDFEETRNVTFTVYPNPGKGEFTVDFTGIENNHEITAGMYDAAGRLVYEQLFDTQNLASNSFRIIPGTGIVPGNYSIVFTMEGIRYSVKVLVE